MGNQLRVRTKEINCEAQLACIDRAATAVREAGCPGSTLLFRLRQKRKRIPGGLREFRGSARPGPDRSCAPGVSRNVSRIRPRAHRSAYSLPSLSVIADAATHFS